MDEAHQARVHRRDVVVAADGIASVTVTLEDCIADKPLVLATLSPPYSVIEFQPFAYDETNTQIQVERHETRRRVVIAAIRPQPFVGRRSLTWKFRVSNAYPFTLRDLIVPPENFYQTGAAEHAGRSCVLRVSAAELVQSIRFEQAEAPLGQPRAARTLVEAQRDHWHGVGKQWVRDGAASTAVDTDGSRLVARFKSPLIARRYGIVFKLEEVQRSRAHDELSKQWIEAQRWICRLANVRGERSRSAIKLQRQLTRATHRQLCEQFEVKDLDCEISWTSKGFIWHAASHTLRPTFGCFRIDDWAQEFPYGEGVVGHAFRFDGETTYDGEHNRTIICRRDDAAWIVCLPLRYRGTCVGVVSFAGTDRPADVVGQRLLDLAKTKVLIEAAGTTHDETCRCSVCEHNRVLGSLTWRINCAFWGTLAVSEFLSNAERKAAFDALDDWRARETATSSKPSWPTPASSISQADRSKPSRPDAEPPTVAKSNARKPRRRISQKDRVAIITGAFAVLAALLTVGPKYLALPGAHKAAETTANSVQRPMTVDEFKAALTDRSLVTKISGGAKLPRLENLDLRSYHFDGFDLRSAETLSHTDLTHAYLNDAVLAGVALLETTFVDASLRRANLTNSDLRGSNLTRADLHGANLLHADVRGAVLVDARGLTDEQLSQACGDDQTLLSPGQFISRTWSCQ